MADLKFPSPADYTQEELEEMTEYRRSLTTMSPARLAEEWTRVTTDLLARAKK